MEYYFQGSPDKRTTEKELLTRFSYYESWRQQWEEKANTWYQQFRGYKEPLKPGERRSNLHIPKTYEAIDTIRARLVNAFFGARPYVDFIPMPENSTRETLDIAEQKAEVASAIVDQQLEKNNIVKIWYDYVTSFLVFPAGILSVGWRYEEKRVRKPVPVPQYSQTPMGPMMQGWTKKTIEEVQAVWDDNEIANVDFYDFWPDPRSTSLDNARGVYHREWITREGLIDLLKFLSQLGYGTVFLRDPSELDRIEDAGASLQEGQRDRLSSVGLHQAGHDPYSQSKDPKDKKGTLFELLHYWEDDRRSILINRKELAYDGPSPYWRHGKKPFVVESYDPLPNEFYGLSAVQLIEHLQDELNTQHNQRIDNVSFIINKLWKVRRGADVNETDLVSRPGGVIYVDDMNDVDEARTSDVTVSAYNEQSFTERTLENTLAVPPVIRGVEGQKTETATEAALKASNASVRYDVRILLFEAMGIKRLAKLMDLNNQQFIDGQRLIRLGPEESVQWRLVQPGEIVGEFDYRPAGTSIDPAANKEVRRQQLSEMLAFLISTGNPYVDLYELTKAWFESFDIRNVQKFLIPREIVEQMMQQQQQMMAMMPPEEGDGSPPTPPPMMMQGQQPGFAEPGGPIRPHPAGIMREQGGGLGG